MDCCINVRFFNYMYNITGCNMKRFSYLLILLLVVMTAAARQAKYVFFFIGDGMGVNQINATEMWLAEQEGRIGVEPLLMTSFPVATMATTYSATNSVTDSSAGGTALAAGVKTYNGAIGVDKDKNPVRSIAEQAKQSGRRVGVATSVSVDHATPASFYAHQPDRNWYYEIALDLPKAGFDFYAGSGFKKPETTHDRQEADNIFAVFEKEGYTVARGVEEYDAKAAAAKKMVLVQKEGADVSSLSYAIDHKDGQMTLTEITESAVDFLSKDLGKGFFLMVEGGKIDWSAHNNDAATTFTEIVDFDNAIKVAYEFYKKHPKETLIVVSADHETGGLGLASGGLYELRLKNLTSQKASLEELSRHITSMRKMRKRLSWEVMKDVLAEKMGFWKDIDLTWKQERLLHDAYDESFGRNKARYEERMYSRTEPLASAAIAVMNEVALLGWSTGGHSAGYVPVYAVGAGQELFTGKMDNTDIPKKIAKAAGYKR